MLWAIFLPHPFFPFFSTPCPRVLVSSCSCLSHCPSPQSHFPALHILCKNPRHQVVSLPLFSKCRDTQRLNNSLKVTQLVNVKLDLEGSWNHDVPESCREPSESCGHEFINNLPGRGITCSRLCV